MATELRVTHSPWGGVQTQTTRAEGIIEVTTASHGGFLLSEERLAQMPPRLRGRNAYGGGRWFEEDCEWALVAIAFPAYFTAEEVKDAVRTLLTYYPEVLGEGAGREGKGP